MAGPERGTVIVHPDASAEAAHRLHGPAGDPLRERGELRVHVGRAPDDAAYADRIRDADAIILGWDLPGPVMAQAPHLGVVAFTGIGAGNYVDLDLARERGVTVCNTPGYADNTVAEHALALTLAAARHVPRLDRDLRAGHWNQSLPGRELRGLTVGLIGLGGIAVRFAELAGALGMRVCAWTRNPSPERPGADRVELMSLDRLLQESDVISVHIAHSEETTGLLGAEAFARMRPGVILVNTARGPIVDEDALVEALRCGRVAAAGLDVYQAEPPAPGNPLLELDNVVLSPHVAFNTPQAFAALLDISIDNVTRYLDGEPVNVVGAAHPG